MCLGVGLCEGTCVCVCEGNGCMMVEGANVCVRVCKYVCGG